MISFPDSAIQPLLLQMRLKVTSELGILWKRDIQPFVFNAMAYFFLFRFDDTSSQYEHQHTEISPHAEVNSVKTTAVGNYGFLQSVQQMLNSHINVLFSNKYQPVSNTEARGNFLRVSGSRMPHDNCRPCERHWTRVAQRRTNQPHPPSG